MTLDAVVVCLFPVVGTRVDGAVLRRRELVEASGVDAVHLVVLTSMGDYPEYVSTRE